MVVGHKKPRLMLRLFIVLAVCLCYNVCDIKIFNIFSFLTLEHGNMAIERALSIIKPDAVAKNVIGQIYTRFENAGLKIVAAQMKQLSQADAYHGVPYNREW